MKEPLICPFCLSDNVYRNKISAQKVALWVLLLGFPILVKNKTCHCFKCGADFKLSKVKFAPDKKI